MDKTTPDFGKFAECVLDSVETRAKRLLAFMYFRSKFLGGNVTLEDIQNDFVVAGLGKLPNDFIRKVFTKDQRVRRISHDTWLIPADRLRTIELELNLWSCLPDTAASTKSKATSVAKPKAARAVGSYVDPRRLKELKKIKNPKFDLSRLMQMCLELNDNDAKANYISTILLVRAILDHVPPIFGFATFKEVANNFATTKSIKTNLQHLENSSRSIADAHLHTPIRNKETLPTKAQINFSPDLDVLLSEIVRLL